MIKVENGKHTIKGKVEDITGELAIVVVALAKDLSNRTNIDVSSLVSGIVADIKINTQKIMEGTNER